MMQKREAHRFNKLYTKFIQALELQGYAHVTVDSYGRGIRRVAEYFECCPDQRLTPDDLRGYFAELLKTHSWSTIKLDRNALRLINVTNVAMSSALIKMEKPEAACDLLSECVLNARLIGDLKAAMDAYKNLAEIYFSMNEKDLCYEAYRSLFELSERYGHANLATHARNSLIKVEMLK